jgi:dTDP-4-dehydrorhamnose reductase
MDKKNRIVVTGGTGRFGKVLQKNVGENYLFPSKKELNILNLTSVLKYLKKKKPKYLIHTAGLSRPMHLHEKNIEESIQLNIIGTANVVTVCSKLNIKIIYFSSSYVYPGLKGNYKETDPLLPSNNYSWSKLGGECAVQMYKNSLILRVSMTEKPFVHKSAFVNMISNFIFHREFITIFKKIINKKGIINIGGKSQSVFNFAKRYNKKVKKSFLRNQSNFIVPLNSSMNLKKLHQIIRK